MLQCVAAIAFSLPCVQLPPEPQRFGYEIAIAVPAPQRFAWDLFDVSAVLIPEIAETPPLPIPRPAHIPPVQERPKKKRSGKKIDVDPGVVMTAYAPVPPPRGMAALSERSLKKRYAPGKLYVLADGNEDMRCVVKNARLMRAMEKIRGHYGRAIIVESGYRSPAYNRKVRGAKHSQHMKCGAVDIRVPGVSKDALRKYARSLSEVGGVGVYVSDMVHIDTGPVRSWDWRVKKKRKRKGEKS